MLPKTVHQGTISPRSSQEMQNVSEVSFIGCFSANGSIFTKQLLCFTTKRYKKKKIIKSMGASIGG